MVKSLDGKVVMDNEKTPDVGQYLEQYADQANQYVDRYVGQHAAPQPANQYAKTIAVIDGNSLLHRAFHAVPLTMNAPDGRHTNACFGFLSMLLKLVDEFKPAGVICAFYAGIPAFRFEAIEKYKAQRPPTPPELKEQFPIIKELLVALGIPVVSKDGWEGDDILGTVAARAEALGGIRTLLVTGDKDALQLATDKTQIVSTKTGMSDVIVYDPAAVVERFGVEPRRVPDYLGLMGDSSDNIPGVPGVGPKKAALLLQEYGTMEGALACAGEVKGKLGESLREYREQALASRRVATIIRDVDIDLDFESICFPAFDPAEVKRVFGVYALNSHLRKILRLLEAKDGLEQSPPAGAPFITRANAQVNQQTNPQVNAPSNPQVNLPSNPQTNSQENPQANLPSNPLSAEYASFVSPEYHDPLTGKEARLALAAYLNKRETPEAPALALHIEESMASSLFEQNTRRLYIATENSTLCFEEQDFEETLTLAIASARVVAFDIKSILQEVIPRDSSKAAALDICALDHTRLFDLSVMEYLLGSSRTSATLEEMAAAWLADVEPKPDKTQESGAYAAFLVAALYQHLLYALAADESINCYQMIESPLIAVLTEMERVGVSIDPAVLKGLSGQFAVTIETQRKRAFELAGMEFNMDSPKQLGFILFEKLKLPTSKKTRTGYSTNAAVLQELSPLNPLPALMLEYRELAKLKSTYLDALPHLILKDRRLHTSFNQTVTATGRLSSSDPNLQNIPVRTELGRQIRTAFVADPSVFEEQRAVFLSADYSQIELRLLAHLSGDESLIEAFLSGEDFHSSTAAHVFGVPLAEVTPKMRSRAKAVNFGIVYGQQAYGLSQSLGIPFGEAKDMIQRYFAVYPQVQVYLNRTKTQAYEQGWVATLFGRKRHVYEMFSDNQNQRNFGERIAMNHPMQGSAADIIKLAMIEVSRRLKSDGLASQMILQVHDELDFNCAYSEIERLSAMVKETMEGIVKLKVPLIVEVSYGSNWAEAH